MVQYVVQVYKNSWGSVLCRAGPVVFLKAKNQCFEMILWVGAPPSNSVAGRHVPPKKNDASWERMQKRNLQICKGLPFSGSMLVFRRVTTLYERNLLLGVSYIQSRAFQFFPILEGNPWLAWLAISKEKHGYFVGDLAGSDPHPNFAAPAGPRASVP